MLSESTLEKLFPSGQAAFTPPFYVRVTSQGEVFIDDSDGFSFLSFCTHTQMPLDDRRALDREVEYWTEEAKRIVTALNSSYPRVNEG